MRKRHDDTHTHRTRLDANKKERISVEENLALPGKRITEHVDPEFFTFVSRRYNRDKPTVNQFILDVRNCFLSRLKNEFIEDEIANLKALCLQENKKVETSLASFLNQKQNFQRFLKEDDNTSQQLLKEAAESRHQTKIIHKTLEQKLEEWDRIESAIDRLNEKWEDCRKWQWFFESAAPLIWRSKDNQNINIEDNVPFQDPQELLQIFKNMEEKNLTVLLKCEQLRPSVETMREVKDMAVERVILKINKLRDEVATLEVQVIQLEKSVEEKEDNVRKLSNGLVHQLLTNTDALSVIAWAEDAYMRVVEPNDRSLGPIELIKALEIKYEELLLELELQPEELVRETMRGLKLKNKLILKEATTATKKMHQMEMLEKHFLGAIKPKSTKHISRKLRPRSQPPPERKIRKKSPTPPTKEALQEELLFSENATNLYRPLC